MPKTEETLGEDDLISFSDLEALFEEEQEEIKKNRHFPTVKAAQTEIERYLRELKLAKKAAVLYGIFFLLILTKPCRRLALTT